MARGLHSPGNLSPGQTMQLFSCPKCSQVLFFENTTCTTCGQAVGYAPEMARLVAVPAEGSSGAPFQLGLDGSKPASYAKCENFVQQDACNWLVHGGDQQTACRSCRLTEPNPELTTEENREPWLEIERAKRRLIYGLDRLGLPVRSKREDAVSGLTFRFQRGTEEQPVMTGHDNGLITLNIAEANAAYRENMREKLGEGYRTVLGHLRHEIGHYYWDRLIKATPSLSAFRDRFGDPDQSYQEALQRHYSAGPPANWARSFISAYATMHPWEDWAETWAHYLHLVDTLETAKSHGLTLRIPGAKASKQLATEAVAFQDYESLRNSWQAVTLALNDLNRSMGMKDVYPFAPSPAVHEKLRFVHDVIRSQSPALTGKAKARPQRRGWLRRAWNATP
jgi:hypothetical protein